MKMNKIIWIALIGGAVSIIALILSFTLPSNDWATAASLVSSFIGVILSIAAIIYSWQSNKKLDKQLDKLMELIKVLRKEQSNYDHKIYSKELEKTLTSEAIERLKENEENLDIAVESIFDD